MTFIESACAAGARKSAGAERPTSPSKGGSRPMIPRSRISSTVLCALLLPAAGFEVRAQKAPPPQTQTADYVLGVEDRLSISVCKEPGLKWTVAIRPDGKITFPLVGDIQAAGRTSKQLTDDLTAALSRYVKEPVVTVIVEEINNFRISILGEVARQGALVLRRRTRLLEAIALAGGLTQFANRSDVVVIRYDDNDKESLIRVNYKKVLSGENPELNIFLKPGDTIVVNCPSSRGPPRRVPRLRRSRPRRPGRRRRFSPRPVVRSVPQRKRPARRLRSGHGTAGEPGR